MARFRFRLETLLRLRESERQQRRAELAQAYRADELLRQQSEYLASEERDLRKRAQVASGPGVVQVDRLLHAHRYAIVLRARVKMLDAQREQLRREIERRRQSLVEADREVRILEKLKERQLGQFRANEERREGKILDEVGQRCMLAGMAAQDAEPQSLASL